MLFDDRRWNDGVLKTKAVLDQPKIALLERAVLDASIRDVASRRIVPKKISVERAKVGSICIHHL